MYEPDEEANKVHAAFNAGKKQRTRRPRLDSIHSVRFTPEQVDRIRAVAGDNISAFIRRTVLDALYAPAPLRTYRCDHMSISGHFNTPPECGTGCTMTDKPQNQTAATTITVLSSMRVA